MKSHRPFAQIAFLMVIWLTSGCNTLLAALTPTPAPIAASPATATLPPPTATPIASNVVTRIVLGTEYASSEDQAKNCLIVDPLAEPGEYPSGAKVFAFQINVDPTAGDITGIEYTGMDIATTTTTATNCTNYAIILGDPRPNRIAVMFERADGEAWKSGSYQLIISLSNEPTIVIPFDVK